MHERATVDEPTTTRKQPKLLVRMRKTTRPFPNATEREPRATGAAALAGVTLPVDAPSAESTAAAPAATAAATAPSTSTRLPTAAMITTRTRYGN